MVNDGPVTKIAASTSSLFAGLGSGTRSVFFNASYLAMGAVLTNAVRGVYIVVIARALGPELYGVLAYGQSWYMAFLPLALFGLGSVLGRELGLDRSAARGVVESSFALRLVTAGLASFLCVLLGWWSTVDHDLRLLVVTFSVALVGRALATWSQQVFVAVEQSRLSFKQDRVFRPLEVAMGVVLVCFSDDLMSLAILHAAIWWLQAAQGIWLVRRQIASFMLNWDWHSVLTLARSGAPLALASGLAGWLVAGPLVLYAMQDGSTSALTGQLAFPMQVCGVLFGLTAGAVGAAVPVVSRSVARGDSKEVRLIWVTVTASILVSGIGWLLATSLGPTLVPAILGARYLEAADLLGPAVALLGPLVVGVTGQQVLVARRLHHGIVISAALGAGVFTAMLPWLVSREGPVGAIGSAGVGAMLWAISVIAFALRSHGKVDRIGSRSA